MHRRLWQWLWSRDPMRVDWSLAVLLGVMALGSLAGNHRDPTDATDPDWFAVVLVVAANAPLAWRRRQPLRVLAITMTAIGLYFLRGYDEGSQVLSASVAVWTVATRCPQVRTGYLASVGVPLVAAAWLFTSEPSQVGRTTIIAIVLAGVAFAGNNVRLRRENRASEERTELAEAERAVSDERLRIARELHDVVAHAMSIVAVQAGVAAHVIDQQPDEAKRMLENVRATSSQALDEMRRLLGVLRGGDAALAPAPGLHDVGELVDSMRTSGVPVDLTVVGDRADVPAGVDLTAYRIVQEALTNVLKHAGPSATVDVAIVYAPGLVTVTVEDDGRGAAVNADGGHGLLGMRERVSVFGGDLVAGPKPGGGFRVRATLPYSS